MSTLPTVKSNWYLLEEKEKVYIDFFDKRNRPFKGSVAFSVEHAPEKGLEAIRGLAYFTVRGYPDSFVGDKKEEELTPELVAATNNLIMKLTIDYVKEHLYPDATRIRPIRINYALRYRAKLSVNRLKTKKDQAV
ncbi:hypothetical protein ACLPJK_26705 [Pseudomonas aeruginosa]|uniref:hypothetical protein n=1 Tax=Pseudomonas aeruginosa TaxID=287 RepID=UPI003D2D5DB2